MTAPTGGHAAPARQPVITQIDLAEDFPEAVVDGVVEFLGKPRARGWIHLYSAIAAAVAGAALVAVSWSLDSTRAGLATLLYTFTIVAMFTVSAVYHRVTWQSQTTRTWMKRLDHSMIFIFIAGSYTPFAVALGGTEGWVILALVWSIAAIGLIARVTWRGAPRWLAVGSYIGLGWVAIFFLPAIWQAFGAVVVLLMALGGLLYTAGGVVYARKRPTFHEGWFGFHELFHALTIAAFLAQFIAIAITVT